MNWRLIKSFGQIKYFNISYAVIIVVPVFANILHLINERFNYDLRTPDTIKSLYLASLIYAVAIAIYQYACPQIIKDHSGPQDFISKNQIIFENKAPDLKLNIVLAHLNKETQANIYNQILSIHKNISDTPDIRMKTQLSVELETLLTSSYSSSVQSHLERKYNEENHKGKFYIWLAGILYILGTLIIVSLLIIRTILVYNN